MKNWVRISEANGDPSLPSPCSFSSLLFLLFPLTISLELAKAMGSQRSLSIIDCCCYLPI